MKLLIAGSRTIRGGSSLIDYAFQILRLQGLLDVGDLLHYDHVDQNFEIVSGGCNKGPDAGAKLWALENDLGCNYKEFPADWDSFGRSAGPRRNKQMAEYADALVLIWDGESKGSLNMKQNMERLNKPVYEIVVKGAKNE